MPTWKHARRVGVLTAAGAAAFLFGAHDAKAQYGGYGGSVATGSYTTSTSSATSTHVGFCDVGCNMDTPCNYGCTQREQTCASSYFTPSGSTYDNDNGTSGYGSTYRIYAVNSWNSDTAAKTSTDDTLVCENGGLANTETTCGAQNRCIAASGTSQIGTGTDVQNAACSIGSKATLARSSTKPSNGNKWFKLDYKLKPGGKANKTGFSVTADVSVGVTLWNNYIPIAWIDVKGQNKFGSPYDSTSGGVNVYLAGFNVYSYNGIYLDLLSGKTVELAASEYPQSGRAKDKKSYTWSESNGAPVVRTPVGVAYVKVALWAKAGWDFDTQVQMVKQNGNMVGFSASAGPKGYLHAGISASVSVVVAELGITGTVNLLTLAPSMKVFVQAQNPSTKAFDLAFARLYLGADITATTLDGRIDLWLRIFWKKWKVKLVEWAGITRTWRIGNDYGKACMNLLNGEVGQPAMAASDYTEFAAP